MQQAFLPYEIRPPRVHHSCRARGRQHWFSTCKARIQKQGIHAALLPPPSLPSQSSGDNTILRKGRKARIQKAFMSKTASGWSLPMHDANATVIYAQALSRLYEFYRCAGARGGEDYVFVCGIGQVAVIACSCM